MSLYGSNENSNVVAITPVNGNKNFNANNNVVSITPVNGNKNFNANVNVNSLMISKEMKDALKKLVDLGFDKSSHLYKTVFHLFLTEDDLSTINKLLLELTDNKEIYDAVNSILDSLSPEMAREVIKSYQRTHNDNFYKQLSKSVFTESEADGIKMIISHKINSSSSIEEFLVAYYKTLFNIMGTKVNSKNTKSLLFSERNVMISDEIEKININTIELFLKHFVDYKYIPKTSASNSIIMTCALADEPRDLIKRRNTLKPGQKFYLKIYPTSAEFDSSGLKTEKKIYEQLYKLVKYNVTPNIICKTIALNTSDFGVFYENLKNYMSDKKMRELDKAIGEINGTAGEPEDYEWPECEILMTHPGGNGTTLTDCFKDLSLDRVELKHVMFQVFYTLYVFDKIEMSHGDLHSGNIFVITLDAPREFCYKVGEKFFKFTSDKLVKIFDFDHSTICKNTRLEFGLPEPIIIEKVQNDDRMPPHGYFNTNLAETSIYNKNLDLLILYTWGLMIAAEAPKTSAETFRMAYSNFNMFSMDVLRGFSGGSRSPHVSHIQQTYNELANLSYTGGASVPLDVKRKNLRELQRVMGYPIGEDFDFDKYGISDDIAYLNWPQYLLHILRKKFGRIIKSTSQIENNTLWIPDEIVMDKFEILNHSYFSTLQVSDLSQVDATKTPIYSIEAIL